MIVNDGLGCAECGGTCGEGLEGLGDLGLTIFQMEEAADSAAAQQYNAEQVGDYAGAQTANQTAQQIAAQLAQVYSNPPASQASNVASVLAATAPTPVTISAPTSSSISSSITPVGVVSAPNVPATPISIPIQLSPSSNMANQPVVPVVHDVSTGVSTPVSILVATSVLPVAIPTQSTQNQAQQVSGGTNGAVSTQPNQPIDFGGPVITSSQPSGTGFDFSSILSGSLVVGSWSIPFWAIGLGIGGLIWLMEEGEA